MKQFWVVTLLLFSYSIALAQGEDVPDLEQVEILPYRINAQIPVGWRSQGPGIFARGNSLNDLTTLMIQSSPLSRDQLMLTLLPRIGQDMLPEPEGQILGTGGTWDEFIFYAQVEDLEIVTSLALSESDGQIILILLQSLEDDHHLLYEGVFLPALHSVQLSGLEGSSVEQATSQSNRDDLRMIKVFLNWLFTILMNAQN